MANVNLTRRDIDYISRVVATEVPASLQRTAPDQYKAMVEAVVDTITNRVASTGFPDSVEAVVNQDRQFSKIAGPSNLNPYGSVKNAPKADEGLQKMVETHLTQRANGKPSAIGNSVNYANPNYSTSNNLGWISDMANAGGVTLGVGDAIHVHGNAPGAKVPDKYTLSVPGAIGNPSQMDSKVMGFSPSRNPGVPRMEAGFAQGRTFRNTDGSAFAAPSTRFSGLMTPARPGIPERSPRANMSATPTRDFRAPPEPLKITPNKVQTFALPRQAPAVNPAVIQRMQDNLANKMAFARPNPTNMNISGYGFSTPAKPSGAEMNLRNASAPRVSPDFGRAVPGAVSPNSPPSRTPQRAPTNFAFGPTTDESVRWAQRAAAFDAYANEASRRFAAPVPTAPATPAGPAGFTGGGGGWGADGRLPSPNQSRSMTFNPTDNMATDLMFGAPNRQRSMAFNPTDNMATDLMFAPSQRAALGPTNDPSVRAAQADLAKNNRRDQFARDLMRAMPPAQPTRQSAFNPVDNMATDLMFTQTAPQTVNSRPSAPVYDMVDVPQSRTIADQYASYGAGRIAPQVASSATQAMPNVPQTVGPRSPSIRGPASPTVNAPMTQQQRMDKALADMRVGIPPQDIYDENAPGRSGFRGFGAGGFLGNLLTGNIGNMRGIEGGVQLPGLLGVLQNVVQGIGNPQQAQQAAQAVQTVAPALGQVMGLPAAQQAARAGNNMVIGRDANGILGWMADGGLSAGAANAGWASNNPERNYGGYGGGYDPTPV
jgi:hypothetical protein